MFQDKRGALALATAIILGASESRALRRYRDMTPLKALYTTTAPWPGQKGGKRIVIALAGFLFLLACGRAGDVVFSPPASESTSVPTPAPTPTPTPTPDPYREMEKIFFPVLEELRRIPGNEGARVDWEMRGPYSGRVYTTPSGKHKGILYHVYGVEKIPVDLLLPNVRDPRYRPEAGVYLQRGWEVLPNGGAYGWFLPDGRNGFSCSQTGQSASGCRLEEGDVIKVIDPSKGIWLEFTLYSYGEYGFDVPEWEGSPPPTRGGSR
jgi:hypothetical protein